MSLIAWYPLNGDTKDYSGNNLHLTNNEATVDVNGKIGSCYLTNQSNKQYLNVTSSIITDALSNGNDFTVCFWQKVDSCQYAVMNISCGNTSATNRMLHIGMRSANVVSVGFYGDDLNGTFSFSPDKWYHITAVYEKGYQKIYVNGKLINSRKSTNYLIVNGRFNIGSYSNTTTTAFYNDVRIYNEALTTKQIKEISQAKIYHYSLNENIQPIKNLCKQYPIRQNITNNSTYTGTTFGKDEIGEYFIKQSTSYTWDGVGISIPIKTGVYYTVSFEIWCEKSFDLMYDYNISCNNITGNDAPRAEALNLLGTSYDTPKRWKKFAMRSKAKDDAVNPRLHDAIAGYFPNNANMVGTKVYFRNVMVEEKDREASYVEDSKSVILKNIDGYKDLSIASTQTYRFPKYEGNSLKFSPYSYITTDFTLSTYNLGNSSSQLTTASWIKPTAVPATNSYGLIYGRADYQGFGLYFSYQDSSNIRVCTYHRLSNGMNTTASKLIKINEWSHVACVLDNTTSIIKMYINGEKIAEGPASTGDFTSNSNTFLLGGVHYPNGNGPWANFEGYIKDFRMYTTVLSDSDIKQLCKPETSIDKANVIRCSEINEEKIENKNGFSKDASITYNEFNEIPNIESGVHNLRLGNEILPVLVDMDNDGGRWARVFYHNCKSGTVLFSRDNSFAEAKETNINAPTTSDKYSILSKLENFRPNTNSLFEFRLKYPTDTDSGLNKWTMKHYSNVTLASAETYPLLSDIEGLTPASETIIEDTNNFIPSLVGDYYIRHYKTKVYSSIAKNINFQIKSDDGVTCYVNNNIAFQKKTSAFNDVKISLNKGWNTLEFLYYENAGQDYLTLNQKISELVDILDYNGTYNGSNIWKQTSNPTYQKVIGYKPIKIDWTHNYWGGLEYNGNTSTLIDGSANHGNWYYAIGAASKHGDGIPSCTNVNNNGTTTNDVELWVRINNYDLFADNFIENVSISKDGILTAKEFREI